ncbi:TetR family transcriptional regulator [Adhaeribacter aerolatus]|uniref:TetR family transcriptional regulator n=1 Tax=Adhaeribacter aerolatus TaxID=670289 RepID=A0A512B0D6_9BACT|nr:TetR/AcrR family transcriptional regulator [Adhaeribacter aerolatus]GEO05430.1 TetR family transcriptional regulator [Adhaeribacter aerolatus]
MAASIHISLNHKSYLREPESTELGRKIISESIKMIDALGFEQFTFKKLAAEIGSTEASIYRYFENKHKLLVYLVSWYWAWVDYTVTFQTHNLPDPRQRLDRALEELVNAGQEDDPSVAYIDERILYRIVMAESSKVYLTKEVDAENKEGFFLEIKKFCRHLAQLVLAVNPDYPYPHALVSTVMEAAHQQLYFASHLPSLTEIKYSQRPVEETIQFLKHLVYSAIDNSK